MFSLGGIFLWVCCLWSPGAPLLLVGYEGSAEPSLLSPVPCEAPNSTRVKSAIPTVVGWTNTFEVPTILGAASGTQLETGEISSQILCWFLGVEAKTMVVSVTPQAASWLRSFCVLDTALHF